MKKSPFYIFTLLIFIACTPIYAKDPFFGTHHVHFLWSWDAEYTSDPEARAAKIAQLKEWHGFMDEIGLGTLRMPTNWYAIQRDKKVDEIPVKYEGYIDSNGYPQPLTPGVYIPDPNGYYMPNESEDLVGESPYQLRFVNPDHLKNLDGVIASIPEDMEIIFTIQVADCPKWIRQFYNFNPSIYKIHLENYSKFLSNRYGGRVRAWMIGNEVDNQNDLWVLVPPASWPWDQNAGWDGWVFAGSVFLPAKNAIQSIDPTAVVTSSFSTNGSLGIYYRWEDDLGPWWTDNWSTTNEDARVMIRPNFLHEMYYYAEQNSLSKDALLNVIAIHPYHWWSYYTYGAHTIFQPRILTYGNEVYPEMHDGTTWYAPTWGTDWDDAYDAATNLSNYPTDYDTNPDHRPKIIVTPENWGGLGPQATTEVLRDFSIGYKPIWWTEFSAEDDPTQSWSSRSETRATGLYEIYTDVNDHNLRYHIYYPLERAVWWYFQDDTINLVPCGLIGDRTSDIGGNQRKAAFYAYRNVIFEQNAHTALVDNFSNFYTTYGRNPTTNIDETIWDSTTIEGDVSVDLQDNELILDPPSTAWGRAGISMDRELYYDDPYKMKSFSFRFRPEQQTGAGVLGVISIGTETPDTVLHWTTIEGFVIRLHVKQVLFDSIVVDYLHVFNKDNTTGEGTTIYHYDNSTGMTVPDSRILFKFNEVGDWELRFGNDEVLPSSGTYAYSEYPHQSFNGKIGARIDIWNNGSDGSGRGLGIFKDIELRRIPIIMKDPLEIPGYDIDTFSGALPTTFADSFNNPYWEQIGKINSGSWTYWDAWNQRQNFGDSRAWHSNGALHLRPPSGGSGTTRVGVSLNRIIRKDTSTKTVEFDVSPEINSAWAVFSLSPSVIEDDVDGWEYKQDAKISYWLKIKRTSTNYIATEVWYKASGTSGSGSMLNSQSVYTTGGSFATIKLIVGSNTFRLYVNGTQKWSNLTNSTGISKGFSFRLSSRYLNDTTHGTVIIDNVNVF